MMEDDDEEWYTLTPKGQRVADQLVKMRRMGLDWDESYYDENDNVWVRGVKWQS